MAQVVLISTFERIESTGLRILSACLKQAGFETRIVFLPDICGPMSGSGYDEERVPARALEQIAGLCEGAALIGIGLMTSSFGLARRLTQSLRTTVSVPIVWGGIHPTLCPEECLRYADLVCIGEGEQTVVELVERVVAGGDPRNVHTLAWLDADGALVQNPRYPLVSDLDRLPFPDYDWTDHHMLHEGQVVPCTRALMYLLLTELADWTEAPAYNVLTARGCPHRCTYCANDAMRRVYPHWGKLRRRSPENVIAEIQAVRARLPEIGAITVRDETFLSSPKSYVEAFCGRYRVEVGLPFRAYTTPLAVEPSKVCLLFDAGLDVLMMGIQTGASHIQELYDRPFTNEQVIRAARAIHDLQPRGCRPRYDLITDNPCETDEDRFETLQLVHSLPRPFHLSLYSLTLYPGTRILERARADGWTVNGERSGYRHRFQGVSANYYNLALMCHSWNVPQQVLDLLVRPSTFRCLRRGPLNGLCGRLLSGLLALRLWRNRRRWSRRRRQWLSGGTGHRTSSLVEGGGPLQ
jgi:radical SAM superfamily enzyme YgiQ (UPF0313 family)